MARNPFVIAMDAINPQKRSRLCFVDQISSLCGKRISSLCGKEISVFTLCRDSDGDGAWQEERDLIRPRYVLSKVFPRPRVHHGRHGHHHDQDDDHDDDHQT